MPESDTDDVLVACLAVGRSVAASARKAGVSESTARRRMADGDFRKRVDALRGEIVTQAVAKLGKAMAGATGQLIRLAKSARSEAVRRSACRDLLELSLKARSTEELEKEVNEIKSRLDMLAREKKRGR